MGGFSMLFVSGISRMEDAWLVVSCWRMGWGHFWGFSFLPACGFALLQAGRNWGLAHGGPTRIGWLRRKIAWLGESKYCFCGAEWLCSRDQLDRMAMGWLLGVRGSLGSLELTLPSWFWCLHGDVVMFCEAGCSVLAYGALTPRFRCRWSRRGQSPRRVTTPKSRRRRRVPVLHSSQKLVSTMLIIRDKLAGSCVRRTMAPGWNRWPGSWATCQRHGPDSGTGAEF